MGTESHLETTVRDARVYINSQLDKGKAAKCPCCTQTVKVYKRKLNAGMSRALIVLYNYSSPMGETVHMGKLLTERKINAANTEYPKLAYWGLIKKMPKAAEVTHKKDSGYWEITALGRAFVEDRVKVPAYMEVFNKRVLRPGGDRVGIRDTLGREFDYQELMSA